MAAPALIYCAACNTTLWHIAVAAGFRYGARLPGTVYAPLYFADQDWKRPNRGRYMEALAQHRPTLATVLDWERPEQEDEVLDWASEAARWADSVLVIPKVPGMLDRIPGTVGGKPVVLAYSVPTRYGGTTVPLWEFGRRPVHLLGGSPQKQLDLARYLNVVSADGNMANLMAHRCRVWTPRPWGPNRLRWVQLRDLGDGRSEGANAQAFRLSCKNIMAAWRARGEQDFS